MKVVLREQAPVWSLYALIIIVATILYSQLAGPDGHWWWVILLVGFVFAPLVTALMFMVLVLWEAMWKKILKEEYPKHD